MAKKKVQSISETIGSVLVKEITRNTWQVSTLVAIDQGIHTLVQKQILPLPCSSALDFLEETCEQCPIPWIFLFVEANRTLNAPEVDYSLDVLQDVLISHGGIFSQNIMTQPSQNLLLTDHDGCGGSGNLVPEYLTRSRMRMEVRFTVIQNAVRPTAYGPSLILTANDFFFGSQAILVLDAKDV